MSQPSFDVEAVRKDFPVLSREVNGRPLVYLDNASSSHKPRQCRGERHARSFRRGVGVAGQALALTYLS